MNIVSCGFFITLEGGEGTGKSTQSSLLAEKLQAEGKQVVQTREPGGTQSAENIRNLLVNGNPDAWSPVGEALLVFAARDDHLRQRIVPALNAGKVVICDRFIDSTWAYQGIAGGVDAEFIASLERHVIKANMPDLTLVFDLDPKIGLARAQARAEGAEGRFEAKGLDFHKKIRTAFLDIAKKSPDRCVVVDASTTIKDIETQVWQIVRDRIF